MTDTDHHSEETGVHNRSVGRAGVAGRASSAGPLSADLVERLAAAAVTPGEVAKIRRRLGMEASVGAVAEALWRSVGQLRLSAIAPATAGGRQGEQAGVTDGASVVGGGASVLVSGVSMPCLLSDTWEFGGPLWVWHRGRPLTDGPAVAVVGTRRPTADGLRMAERMVGGLADAGVTVVSGMARGIDQAAHRGALAAKGRTTAVLGTGFGVAYPSGSEDLLDAVASSGGVVTEYPAGHGIRHPSQFITRNRILVGLAQAVVVIEAGGRSGALNSATWTAEFGRDVMVVPASPSNRAAAGSLALLVDGAIPVRDANDVLELLGEQPGGSPALAGSHTPELSDPILVQVLDLLGPTPITASALAQASGQPIRDVLVAISTLEDKGLVRQDPGGISRR